MEFERLSEADIRQLYTSLEILNQLTDQCIESKDHDDDTAMGGSHPLSETSTEQTRLSPTSDITTVSSESTVGQSYNPSALGGTDQAVAQRRAILFNTNSIDATFLPQDNISYSMSDAGDFRIASSDNRDPSIETVERHIDEARREKTPAAHSMDVTRKPTSEENSFRYANYI